MRIAVVGTGMAGTSHLFDLVSDDRFQVAAVCATHRERAARAAAMFAVPACYTDFRVMLTSEDLDGAVIAVPPQAAPSALRLALRAGLACLVEKPAATGPGELRGLVEGPHNCAARAVVGYNRRYQRHVRAVRGLLASAPVGAGTTVDCRWSGPFVRRYSEGTTHRRNARYGDGVVLDTAAHVIDTLAFLGFAPFGVEVARLTSGPSGADVAALLSLRAGQGDTPIRVTIREGEEEAWSVTLRGPEGQLSLTASELCGTWRHQQVRVPAEYLRRPVDDLLEIAEGRSPYGATLSEAVAVLDTIQQVRVAAGAARRVWRRPRAKALGRLNGSC